MDVLYVYEREQKMSCEQFRCWRWALKRLSEGGSDVITMWPCDIALLIIAVGHVGSSGHGRTERQTCWVANTSVFGACVTFFLSVDGLLRLNTILLDEEVHRYSGWYHVGLVSSSGTTWIDTTAWSWQVAPFGATCIYIGDDRASEENLTK